MFEKNVRGIASLRRPREHTQLELRFSSVGSDSNFIPLRINNATLSHGLFYFG
jgi:hypothetical protein